MSDSHAAANIVISGALILLLLYLYFYEYKYLLKQGARHALFILRGELFDLARSGKVSFKSSVYKRCRNSINGTIRFAHELDLPHVAIMAFLRQPDSMRAANDRSESEHQREMAELPKETRDTIEGMKSRYQKIVLTKTLLSSPFLTIAALPLFVLLVAVLAVRQALAHKPDALVAAPQTLPGGRRRNQLADVTPERMAQRIARRVADTASADMELQAV